MDQLETARVACESGRWGDAWRTLSALPLDQLALDDLDRLATAAYLTGRDEQAFDLWTIAFQRCVEEGRAHHAAAFGAKLARALGFKGDLPRCGGWILRVAELLERGIDRLPRTGLARVRPRLRSPVRARRLRRRRHAVHACGQDRSKVRGHRAHDDGADRPGTHAHLPRRAVRRHDHARCRLRHARGGGGRADGRRRRLLHDHRCLR